MSKIIRFFKDLPFWFRTGIKTQYGTEKAWIRYEEIFIQVIELDNGGYSIAYTDSAPNNFALSDMHLAIKADKYCEVPF